MKHLKSYNEMLMGAGNPAFSDLNKNISTEQEQRNKVADEKNNASYEQNKKNRRIKIENDAKQKGWNGTEDLYNFLVRTKGQQKQNIFQKVGGAIKAGWSGTDEDFILMYDEPKLPYIDPSNTSEWQKQQDQIKKRKQELIQQHQQK